MKPPRPKPASTPDPRLEHLINLSSQMGIRVPPRSETSKPQAKPPVPWGTAKVRMSDGSEKPVLVPSEKDVVGFLMAAAMAPVSKSDMNVTVPAAVVYREYHLAEARRPQDPSLRMLIVQNIICDFLSKKLLADAREGDSESRLLRQISSLKFVSEQRQGILAQKAYQNPPVTPEVTLIEQQNIAREQEVAYSTTEAEQSPLPQVEMMSAGAAHPPIHLDERSPAEEPIASK